jgi:hypothetical protein
MAAPNALGVRNDLAALPFNGGLQLLRTDRPISQSRQICGRTVEICPRPLGDRRCLSIAALTRRTTLSIRASGYCSKT